MLPMPIRRPSSALRTTSSLSPQLGPRVQDGDKGQDVHLRVEHFPKEDEQVRVSRVDKGREETYRGDRRWESRFDGDAKVRQPVKMINIGQRGLFKSDLLRKPEVTYVTSLLINRDVSVYPFLFFLRP
jgi:hypothetical protein